MAITAPISLTQLAAEFGAPNQPLQTSLATYTRGFGYVANHENNQSVSGSVDGLALTQFLNTDKDFDTIYGTNSGYWTSSGQNGWSGYGAYGGDRYESAAGFFLPGVTNTMSPSPFASFQYIGGSMGSMNNYNYIGPTKFGSSTDDRSNIMAAFDWGITTDPLGGNPHNAFTFALGGNQTGVNSSWISVTISSPDDPYMGGTFTKSTAADIFYSSSVNLTRWTWYSPAGFPVTPYDPSQLLPPVTGNFRIEVNY